MKLKDPKILIPVILVLIALGALAAKTMHSHDPATNEHGHSHDDDHGHEH